MEKVANIIRQKKIKEVFYILFLFFNIFCHGQEKIEGHYKLDDVKFPRLETNVTVFIFYKNGIFEDTTAMELSGFIPNNGKGHYFLSKDSLILNYDLSELKYEPYCKIKQYANYSTDSVKLNITVYDENGKLVPNIYVLSDYENKFTDKEGKVLFKHIKKDEDREILVRNQEKNYYFYKSLKGNRNYEIEIFLSPTTPYNPVQKDQISRSRVIEATENYDSIVIENERWKRRILIKVR